MMEQVKTLEELETSQNKSFDEIKAEWQKIQKELPEKESKLASTQDGITSLESRHRAMFQKHSIDEARLGAFEALKNQLEGLGLDLS